MKVRVTKNVSRLKQAQQIVSAVQIVQAEKRKNRKEELQSECLSLSLNDKRVSKFDRPNRCSRCGKKIPIFHPSPGQSNTDKLCIACKAEYSF